MIRLRGHHLLCLLGYRGMGYSPAYVENMTKVQRQLRTNELTRVQIVAGPDDLCEKFPSDEQHCHCLDANVHQRDMNILQTLQIEIGEERTWQDIEDNIRQRIVPDDVATFCHTCPWLSYGVCRDGIERIHNGLGLFDV